MKESVNHPFRSLISLLLVFCLVLSFVPTLALTARAEEITETETPIVYVSIGDSMTNGYCLDGYEGNSGAVNYGMDSYANKFAAWLAGYTGTIKNDQVIFEGANGIVDHRPLAISGMRAQDIQWALNLDYTDADLMNAVFQMDYSGSWNESTWYDTWNFVGDRRTWSDFCDYDFRYADAAAKILAIYNSGDNGKYFQSGYADETQIANAINGIKANPYFPEGRSQTDSIGGYKFLQIATEFYQESVKDADVISLAVGNTNFGTFMLTEILDVVMSNDTSFAGTYSYDRVMAQADDFAKAKVQEMLTSSEYQEIVSTCMQLVPDDSDKQSRIEYIIKYAMSSYIVGYIGMMETILEMNPDVDIIQVALMNAYENSNGTVDKDTLGGLVEIIYTPVNRFLKNLPAELAGEYSDADFFFAEAGHVSCMIDVFGDDFYVEPSTYPGLLNGTENYTPNTNSIVRQRFVEEVVCGDMLFSALGLKKANNQTNILNFLNGGSVVNTDGTEAYNGCGVIAYDKMTTVEKAAYAAQNATAAKEYALYLAFENTLIRSGTENVTIHALANLANIFNVFAQFQAPMMAAIEVERANFYNEAAVVVSAASNGALTAEQIVSIMGAVEQVKDQVWAAFADYHQILADTTGHTFLEELLYCDTCQSGSHGDLVNQILSVYADQMDLLPYTIIAQQIEGQTGGMLNGSDVRRLCKAENYEEEVYVLIAEKSDGQLTSEQIKTLKEENGVWIVADEVTGGQYGPDLIKMAYERGLLDEEQSAQIDTLIRVREALIALLGNEQTLKTNASGLVAAIDGASQLSYLLALPQTMSDELYGNSDLRGAFCMNARCVLGTGAGGHPSTAGHQALYTAVINAYKVTPAPEPEPEKEITRLYGSSRVSTAIAVADQLKAVLGCETFDTIIIANGNNFADALTGSYLASVKNAPILLYRGNEVELNEAYIRENLSADGIVYILGGVAAVPAEVEESLTEAGFTVERLYGDTRYATNLKILEAAGIADEEILICTGADYADSLAASATGLPIIMVNSISGKLTDEQIAFFETYADNDFTIIGGNAAVSDELKAEIEAIVGDVNRVKGDSREETAAAIAANYFDGSDCVVIAFSRNFPDGLCGGPLACAMKAPLLLVNANKEGPAANYVAENAIAQGFILGGTAAVSDESVAVIFGN